MHMKFKYEVKSICFINFRKQVSGIVPFTYIGKEEIHKYMQYEASMTVHIGRTANQRKVTKWLPFQKNIKSEYLKK